MKLNYYVENDYETMSKVTAEIIIEHIKNNPTGLFCFAGGDTPVRTIQLVAHAARKREIDLTQAAFIELDEWVGIAPEDTGSCISYLKRNFLDIAEIRENQIHVFDGLSNDLEEECRKASQFIEYHQRISLTLLGVGVNGHIGFNEPGSSFESEAYVSTLDEITQKASEKYFGKKKNTTNKKGITLGMSQLLNANQMIVQASGKRKREAIMKVLQGDVTNRWPVTAIWKHSNAYLLIDKEVME